MTHRAAAAGHAAVPRPMRGCIEASLQASDAAGPDRGDALILDDRQRFPEKIRTHQFRFPGSVRTEINSPIQRRRITGRAALLIDVDPTASRCAAQLSWLASANPQWSCSGLSGSVACDGRNELLNRSGSKGRIGAGLE